MEICAMREYLRNKLEIFQRNSSITLPLLIVNTNTNLILTLLNNFVQNYIYI